MAHHALYRVYRPKTFSDVVGQSRTVITLREAVRQGRLAHAYLFSGPRGTGKTSVARILAKAINCSSPSAEGDPCLLCASCRAVESGQHLDVIEIDAASNRGIDEIRDIKERITHQAAMGLYKVYIVDEVHMLTEPAFNALLKTLEEPPPHVVFILATTEPGKLPVTVLSRCQRYDFERFSVSVIVDRLRYVAEQEKVEAEAEALERIADAADGAMRDALSLFDQCVTEEGRVSASAVSRLLGALESQEVLHLLKALAEPTVSPLVSSLGAIGQAGHDYKRVLRDVARHLRDVLVYRTAGEDLFSPFRRQQLADLDRELPQDIPEDRWLWALDHLAEAEGRLRGGFPPELIVELALFKVQRTLHQKDSAPPVAEVKLSSREVPRAEERSVSKPSEEKPSISAEAAPVEPAPPVGELDHQFLEWVRRERPSTHALLQKAHISLNEGVLVMSFAYAAHYDLMQKPPNSDVLQRAVQKVYGSDVTYRMVAGSAESGGEAATPQASPPSLKEEVKAWFGNEVKLTGFDG